MKLTTAFSIISACLVAGSAVADQRVPLLNVTAGQLPNDTAQDDQSKLSIEPNHPAIGGPALKVVYARNDSFGMSRGAAVRNWEPFVAVEFTAFNPANVNVIVHFVVKHRRSTSYQTRIDMPVTLQPGKNVVRLGIDELMNVNGSTPDLSTVLHWYMSVKSGTPTLYFSDIWLTGGQQQQTISRSPSVGPVPTGPINLRGTYRIRGTIGNQKVDLLITPDDASISTSSQSVGAVAQLKSDPARLARIRSHQMPAISEPVLFDTPQADVILSALEVFPPDNAFNQLIEDWPLHPNSENIVASVGLDKPLRYNRDMAFVIVPADQPRVDVTLLAHASESDRGPYPIPQNVPIEGWPVRYQSGTAPQPTLAQVQQRPAGHEGDRHAIIIDPVRGKLYEFFTFGRTQTGWAADQASIFDLKSNRLRPQGWTSADAAGLPIFPAVVRHDEIQRGLVEHAMRVTVRKTRRDFVHPATHYASRHDDDDLPRMGERLRLRSDFDISKFSPAAQAILKGLKKYGMFVADNGIEWAISVTPDARIPVLHEELRKIRGSDFEVVVAPLGLASN